MFRSLTHRVASVYGAVQRYAALGLLTIFGPQALMAADQVIKQVDIGDDHLDGAELGGGGEMVQAAGSQINAVVLLIFGPGMYLLMGIGAIVAIFGFLRGNKESLFTGVGVFILAALLRALMPIFIG